MAAKFDWLQNPLMLPSPEGKIEYLPPLMAPKMYANRSSVAPHLSPKPFSANINTSRIIKNAKLNAEK